MSKDYIQDKNFIDINFSEKQFFPGEYDNCTFSNCIFTNANLSDFSFEECSFNTCDFSNAKTTNTTFQSVAFKNCKLLGLHFDDCNRFLFSLRFNTSRLASGSKNIFFNASWACPEDYLLSFYFENCQLNLSSFYQLKIKNTKFKNCILQEVDFTESNLTGSGFESCDFSGAMFANTILEKADFRTSINYSINPELNRIQKAKFSLQGITGLLDKYDITIE